MKRALISSLVLFAASGPAGTVFAQDGGADTGAPDAYAAAAKPAFYDVEGRIAAYEAKAASLGAERARTLAALRQIKAFAAQQKARHEGELRDWDREAITERLNALAARTPALAG